MKPDSIPVDYKPSNCLSVFEEVTESESLKDTVNNMILNSSFPATGNTE